MHHAHRKYAPPALLIALVLAVAPTAAMAQDKPVPNSIARPTPAQQLESALAQWRIAEATSGNDAEVAKTIEDLAARAQTLLAQERADVNVAAVAAAVREARTQFRKARGLDAKAAVAITAAQQPDVSRADVEVINHALLQLLHGPAGESEREAILRFGQRAVPTLVEQASLMTPESALGQHAVAFDCLAALDPLRALDVALVLAAQPSFLIRRTVAEALTARGVFSKDQVWVDADGGDYRLAKPEHAQVLDHLLSEPAAPPKSLQAPVHLCIERGYVPPQVATFVFAQPGTFRSLPGGVVLPGARALYVQGLTSGSEMMRESCLSSVLSFPDVDPALAQYNSPSEKSRKLIAAALDKRMVLDPTSFQDGGFRSASSTLVTPTLVAATRALLDDDSPQVRGTALNALRERWQYSAPPILSHEQLVEYVPRMRHADARSELLRTILFAWEGADPVPFVDLALADPAPEVLQVLMDVVNGKRVPLTDMRYWRCLERVLADAPRAAQTKRFDDALSFAPLDAASAAAFSDWVAARGDPVLGARAFEQHSGEQGQGEFHGWVRLLDDARYARVIESHAPYSSRTIWRTQDHAYVSKDPAPWIELVKKSGAPAVARLVAHRWALAGSTHDRATVDGLVKGFVEAVGDAPQSENDHQLANVVLSIGARLHKAGGNAAEWYVQLFESKRVSMEVLHDTRVPDAPFSPAESARFVEAALARYPLATWGQTKPSEFRVAIVKTARSIPLEQRAAVLETALAVGENAAYEVLSSDPRPELLFVLQRLVASGKPYSRTRAAQAAAAFLSNEAAKLILDIAAVTGDSGERTTVLAALDQVTQYQAAKSRWEQRSDAAAVRLRAIGELTSLLDDPATPENQHAEALRGLGLLGAVEELPRLVRALSSPSATLQTAAREALARLNQEGKN